MVAIPHFDVLERWSPALIDRAHASLVDGQLLVGIDEDTALVGGPRGWRVRGRGRVCLIDAEGRRRHHLPGTELTVGQKAKPLNLKPEASPLRSGASGDLIMG